MIAYPYAPTSGDSVCVAAGKPCCGQKRRCGQKTALSENGPAACAVGAPMEAKRRIARKARVIHSEIWCKCGRRICGRHRATSLPISGLELSLPADASRGQTRAFGV